MKKSLYKKFYFTFLAIVLAVFCLFGSVVLTFSGNYWLTQNKSRLLAQAQTVADQIGAAAQVYVGSDLIRYIGQMAQVIGAAADCGVLVVNTDGQLVASVGSESTGQPVPESGLAPYLAEAGTDVTTLGGAFSQDCLMAAVPVTVGGRTAAVAIAMLPMSEVGEFTRSLLRLLIIAVVVVSLPAALAAYTMASAMVRPLRQMSDAAGCLARGDFSRRIDVNRKDELGQLADAFNRMTRSLEAGERMRRGFVANVSHELKTPMTTISGFIDGILDGTVPPDRRQEYLSIVSDEVKRLSRLVNTMLDLSRLESGDVRLQPAPMDLTQTVIHTALLLESRAEEKNLSLFGLSDLPPLRVVADPDLMTQVVYNLLDNAVKYTPPDGEIRLTGEDAGSTVRLCVRNTGVGIAEADLPFVFDRFYKVDRSRGADKNSLGLGLYLVKTIVTLHQGSVTVRSKENEFCEFELTLNAAPPALADDAPRKEQA